jgi:hypothetical protein
MIRDRPDSVSKEVVSQRHTHRVRHLTSRKLVVVLATAAVAGTATAAGASTIEHLGFAGASASVAPSCPGLPCEAITATTGFQAAIAGAHDAMVIHHAGTLTSWSITLGAATADQIVFFDRVAHGPAQAGIVILRQGANYRYRVAEASPLIALNPYFGRTTSFTLTRPLPVAPGEVVGLSVPTWAPALAIGLGSSSGWRASRAGGACDDLFTPSAQTAKGALAKYVCVYRTARITYGATVADTPTAPARKPATGQPEAAPKKPAAKSGAAAAPASAAGASAHP